MKCGDRPGYLNAAGQPCGQTIGRKGCLHHDRPAEALAAQRRGNTASRMAMLLSAKAVADLSFGSRETIVGWCERMAKIVLTVPVDPRRVAEARALAQTALTAHDLAAQDRLDAIERLVMGEAERVA